MKPIRLELLTQERPRATIGERQASLRAVRTSLERLLTATGDVKDLVTRLNALRKRLRETLDASRRLN
jgi:hypothetical protein